MLGVIWAAAPAAGASVMLLVLFGLIGSVSAPAGIAGLVIAAWEFSLGVYLTFWGFKPSAITADM